MLLSFVFVCWFHYKLCFYLFLKFFFLFLCFVIYVIGISSFFYLFVFICSYFYSFWSVLPLFSLFCLVFSFIVFSSILFFFWRWSFVVVAFIKIPQLFALKPQMNFQKFLLLGSFPRSKEWIKENKHIQSHRVHILRQLKLTPPTRLPPS